MNVRRIQERLGQRRFQLAVVRGELQLERPGDHDRGLLAGQIPVRIEIAFRHPVDDARPCGRLDAGVIPYAGSRGRNDVEERLVVVVIQRNIESFDKERRKLAARRQIVGPEFADPQIGHDPLRVQGVQYVASPRVIRNVAEASVQLHDFVIPEVVERYGDRVVFRVDFPADISPFAVIRIGENGDRRSGVVDDVRIVGQRQLPAVGRNDFAGSLEVLGEVDLLVAGHRNRIRRQPLRCRIRRILAETAVDPVNVGHQRKVARVRRAQEPEFQVVLDLDGGVAVLRPSVRIPVDDVAVIVATLDDAVGGIGDPEQQFRIRVVLRHAAGILGGRLHDRSFRERQRELFVKDGMLRRQRRQVLGVDLYRSRIKDVDGFCNRRAIPDDFNADCVVLVLFQADKIVNEPVFEIRPPGRFVAVDQHLRRAVRLDIEVDEVFVDDDLVAYGRLRRQNPEGRSFAGDLNPLRRPRSRGIDQFQVVRMRAGIGKRQVAEPNNKFVAVVGVIISKRRAVDRARNLRCHLGRQRVQIQAEERRRAAEVQVQLRCAAPPKHEVVRRSARHVLLVRINEFVRQSENSRQNFVGKVRRIYGRERCAVIAGRRMEIRNRRDVLVDDVNFQLLRYFLPVAGSVKRNAGEQDGVLAVD